MKKSIEKLILLVVIILPFTVCGMGNGGTMRSDTIPIKGSFKKQPVKNSQGAGQSSSPDFSWLDEESMPGRSMHGQEGANQDCSRSVPRGCAPISTMKPVLEKPVLDQYGNVRWVPDGCRSFETLCQQTESSQQPPQVAQIAPQTAPTARRNQQGQPSSSPIAIKSSGSYDLRSQSGLRTSSDMSETWHEADILFGTLAPQIVPLVIAPQAVQKAPLVALHAIQKSAQENGSTLQQHTGSVGAEQSRESLPATPYGLSQMSQEQQSRLRGSGQSDEEKEKLMKLQKELGG